MSEEPKVARLVRPHLTDVGGYEGVEPPEVLAQRSGIPPEKILKLNGNENPYGCSPLVLKALASYRSYNIYPDPEQAKVRLALAQYSGVGLENVVAGNGCDELIDLVARLFLEPGDRVVDCTPTFGMYSFCTKVCGGRVVEIQRTPAFDLDVPEIIAALNAGAKMIFLASPNNPTGNLTPMNQMKQLLETGAVIVVDETYYEFCSVTVAPLVERYDNLVVLRTLSKWAGLAGLRAGYGIMSPYLAKRIMKIKPPYNMNTAAELAILASLQDRKFLLSKVTQILQERERMHGILAQVQGVQPLPSRGNFLLCQVPSGRGRLVYEGLAERGVFVRYFDTPRLRDYVRISVGLPEHTPVVVEAMKAVV